MKTLSIVTIITLIAALITIIGFFSGKQTILEFIGFSEDGDTNIQRSRYDDSDINQNIEPFVEDNVNRKPAKTPDKQVEDDAEMTIPLDHALDAKEIDNFKASEEIYSEDIFEDRVFDIDESSGTIYINATDLSDYMKDNIRKMTNMFKVGDIDSGFIFIDQLFDAIDEGIIECDTEFYDDGNKIRYRIGNSNTSTINIKVNGSVIYNGKVLKSKADN